jgi:hypothetical protein
MTKIRKYSKKRSKKRSIKIKKSIDEGQPLKLLNDFLLDPDHDAYYMVDANMIIGYINKVYIG